MLLNYFRCLTVNVSKKDREAGFRLGSVYNTHIIRNGFQPIFKRAYRKNALVQTYMCSIKSIRFNGFRLKQNNHVTVQNGLKPAPVDISDALYSIGMGFSTFLKGLIVKML